MFLRCIIITSIYGSIHQNCSSERKRKGVATRAYEQSKEKKSTRRCTIFKLFEHTNCPVDTKGWVQPRVDELPGCWYGTTVSLWLDCDRMSCDAKKKIVGVDRDKWRSRGFELLEKRNRVRFDLLSPTPHPSTRVLYASPLASSSLELTREVFVTWPEGDEVGMGWRGLLRAGGIDWQRRLASWLAPTVFVMCVHVCACVCVHVRRWSGTWHVQNVSEVWRQWSVRRTLESTLQKVPICSEDWDSH